MRTIVVKDKPVIIAAINNGPLQLLGLKQK
jgi:hypothetical protein